MQVSRAFCVAAATAAILAARAAVAAPTTSAVLSITDSVVAAGVEPIGGNIGTVMGGTNYATNQFMRGTGFEPSVSRWLRRVDSSGSNWFTWNGYGGVNEYDLDSTGYGNGSTIRFYRIVNSAGQPLAWATGADMSDPTGADHVIFVGQYHVPMPGGTLKKGGWIAQGDSAGMPDTNRVYLDSNVTLYRGDYAFIVTKKTQLVASEINGRLYQYNSDISDAGMLFKPAAWHAKLVPHPGTPLPQAFLDEDPGETCYELDALDSTTQSVGQWIFHAYDTSEGQWYGTLLPGAHYRVDVWLRQQGLGNSGKVRFNSNQSYSAVSCTWQVTGTWQKYSYEFTGPNYPNADVWHETMALEVTGPGTLWIDNWAVYQDDAAHENRPFSPCTLGYNEYLRSITPIGKKPSARFYPSTFPSTGSMDRLLSDWDNSGLDFIYNMQAGVQITIPHCLYWCYKSGTSPGTRIVPYFTLHVENTEADWKALVEYLGVPYDSTVDSPTTKPWAHMRFKQRGIGTPWTDEFREIVIEYGNESWQQGNLGWYGFGRPGWTWSGGVEYGLFAHYMFDQQVATMPWWTQYSLGSKIKFALNGGYMVGADQYGENSVVKTTGAVKYVTHANYVGPKWETGQTPDSVFNNDGMQRTLVAADPDFKANYLAKHALYRDQARAKGIIYDLIVYEGGPSGYSLPGSATAQETEVAEEYGKSMGMAVAALDSWLYSSYVGYKFQNYLGYGCGKSGWTSHTQATQGGFRQHCGWMAMAMRNNYARGDQMLQAAFTSLPTYQDTTVSDSAIPLIAAYALNNSAKSVYSVFLLSRKLAGTHNNGVNFGDGFTPVTINLPFTQRPEAIYLYRLAHRDGSWTDPTVNNRDSLRVVIRCDTISPANWAQTFVLNASTGADARGLAPGNIFLYVFALDTNALAVRNPDPAELMASAGADMQSLSAAACATAAFGSGDPAAQRATTTQDQSLKLTTASARVAHAADGRTVFVLDQTRTAGNAEAQTSMAVVSPLASPAWEAVQARGSQAPPNAATRVLPPSMAVVSVSASSFHGIHRPSNTLDGSHTTRWTPSAGGEQWITYDLGAPRAIGSAATSWYSRARVDAPVAVEYSNDGKRWLLAWRGFLVGRGSQQLVCAFQPRQTRYVRLSVDCGDSPISFSEVGIYSNSQEGLAASR